MGIKNALQSLTTNNPTVRDNLVRWMAERCMIDTRENKVTPNETHVWHKIVVLARHNGLEDGEIKKWTRTTIGHIVADIVDAWRLLIQQEV